MLKIEVLSTGEEVRTGVVIDRNAAHIAQVLSDHGHLVSRHACVGDVREDLVQIMGEIASRADACVVTGGLGPTDDDLTAETAALAAGATLVQDEHALASIKAYFDSRNRPMPPCNEKQALLPDGAQLLPNLVGTAPGFALTIKTCRFFFLPGVPHEMKKMLVDQVLPQVATLCDNAVQPFAVRLLATFGLGESAVNEKLTGLATAFPDIQLSYRVKFPQVLLKLYATGAGEDELQVRLHDAVQWVKDRLEHHLVSASGDTMASVVGQLLRQQKATLALAESCTGGLIADWITNVDGSSDYFLFCAVTYADAAKTGILRVAPQTLASHGAVSEPTVAQMAQGARTAVDATYGLATSGIAGPGGGTTQKPVGTVCIGLATDTTVKTYRFCFPFGNRRMHKQIFAMTALDLLRREILQVGDEALATFRHPAVKKSTE